MTTFNSLPPEIHLSISSLLSLPVPEPELETLIDNLRGQLSLLQSCRRFRTLYQDCVLSQLDGILRQDFDSYIILRAGFHGSFTRALGPSGMARKEHAPMIPPRARDVLSLLVKEAPLKAVQDLVELYVEKWGFLENKRLVLVHLVNLAAWWRNLDLLGFVLKFMSEKQMKYLWLGGIYEYGYALPGEEGVKARVGPFLRALADGDIEMMEILRSGDWDANMGICATNSGKTALHYAAQFGQYNMVGWLLSLPESINSRMVEDDYCWNVIHHTVNTIPYLWQPEDRSKWRYAIDEKKALLHLFAKSAVDLEKYLIGNVYPDDGYDLYQWAVDGGGPMDEEIRECLVRVEDNLVEDSLLHPFRTQALDFTTETFPPLLMLANHWKYCGKQSGSGCKNKEECSFVFEMADELSKLIEGWKPNPFHRHMEPYPMYQSLALGIIRCKLAPEYEKAKIVNRILRRRVIRREEQGAVNRYIAREDGTALYWAIIQAPMPDNEDEAEVDYHLIRLLLDYGAQGNIGNKSGVRPLDIARERRLKRAVHWIKNGTHAPVPRVYLSDDLYHTAQWRHHSHSLCPDYVKRFLIDVFHYEEPIREPYTPPRVESEKFDDNASIHSATTYSYTKYSLN